ncbi:MAG: copper resistance CopC family protein [Gammaproteobacteria bacterium]
MVLLKNIACLIILSMSVFQANQGFAHAVVTKSSLQIEQVAPNQETQVTLNFNSNIELALSQIFLVSEGDVHQKLNAVPGAQPGQVLVDLPALEEGEYAIRYKIFAADGHLTEDTIHFFVTP